MAAFDHNPADTVFEVPKGKYIVMWSATSAGTAGATTASHNFHSDCSISWTPPKKRFFTQGIEFRNKKEALAYKNFLKSREISHKLSFFTPHGVTQPPRLVKHISNFSSIKQLAYTKRKRAKEKLGLKH